MLRFCPFIQQLCIDPMLDDLSPATYKGILVVVVVDQCMHEPKQKPSGEYNQNGGLYQNATA
jgi:hypothetical protein